MTRLFNDEKQFAQDALTGMTAAYPDRVTGVHGGVVRATASPAGEIAVVIGGGAGHYPAFAGWVGPGLAHGAACGNVFASPSASQVYSVCRAADNGAGILLMFGNYAGDVLHFGQAAERLRAEGVDVRILPVSDDVASNSTDKARERRGTTGDLVVFKVAAAAAERGASLAEVEAVSWRANDRTRSFGVAFDGCTLPGADAPLFSVPEGQMSLGLGVHGEPGIRDTAMGTASEVADILVDAVLAEQPVRAAAEGYEGRVVVLLNGLGTVKNEELFVAYGRVAERLGEAGLTVVHPEVGEIMTSLDMAGLSLTVTFLDAELEHLWAAPVDTIAFRRGAVAQRKIRTKVVDARTDVTIPEASEASRAQAARVVELLDLLRDTAVAAEPELGRLDAIAGDGDHGQGMSYGTTGAAKAGRAALDAGAGARTVLIRAGEEWSEAAGGTSGALWGAALTAVGGAVSDDASTDDAGVVAALAAGCDAILRLGGAHPGDKTMVDALVPFRETLMAEHAGGAPLAEALASAAVSAAEAAARTADIVARRGRSRVLGEKSLGTPDPGAVSFGMLMTAVARRLAH